MTAPASPTLHLSAGRLGHALGLVVALGVLTFGVVARIARSVPDFWAAGPKSFAVVGLTALLGAGGVVGLGVVKLGGVSLRDVGFRAERPATAFGVGALGFLAKVVIWAAIMAAFGELDVSDTVTTIAGFSAAQRAMFLALGVAVAFTEETVFRGYLQPMLVARAGLLGGIALQAVVFTLYHAPTAPLPLLVRLGFGLVSGMVRGRDRPLWACMIMHALWWTVLGNV